MRSNTDGDIVLTLKPKSTCEKQDPKACVEENQSQATADQRMGFERMKVQYEFSMFGDVQIRIWGAAMVNRRRMYFETATWCI